MALLYRAVWQDFRASLLADAEAALIRWLRGRVGSDMNELPTERLAGCLPDSPDGVGGPFELSVLHRQFGTMTVLQVEFREDRPSPWDLWTFDMFRRSAEVGNRAVLEARGRGDIPSPRELWLTQFTVLAWAGPYPRATLWVDVERVAEDPFARVIWGSPGFVRDLLRSGAENGGRPRADRLDRLPLTPGPRTVTAPELAGLLSQERRTWPVAVAAHPRPPSHLGREAHAMYARLAGMAHVCMLPAQDVDEFNGLVNGDDGLTPGEMRLYLPHPENPLGRAVRRTRQDGVPAMARPRGVEAAGNDFADFVATWLEPHPRPHDYDDELELRLHGPTGDPDDAALLDIAEAEIRVARQDLDQLRAEMAGKDDIVLELLADNEELHRQLNRQAGQFVRRLAPIGNADPQVVLPDVVASTADALRAAQQLVGVVIHPDAPRHIDQLDRAAQAQAWANTIWRGLRALDLYGRGSAEEAIQGGFWQWCQRSGSSWSWPASQKKLAMSESETVMGNRKLRAFRQLPVSTEVDGSGQIEMVAHLKIAEGGGQLAPRIYFYDDTRGATGKVHVGFIGPHKLMPNNQTN